MADCLISMQRYLGSDDEYSNDSVNDVPTEQELQDSTLFSENSPSKKKVKLLSEFPETQSKIYSKETKSIVHFDDKCRKKSASKKRKAESSKNALVKEKRSKLNITDEFLENKESSSRSTVKRKENVSQVLKKKKKSTLESKTVKDDNFQVIGQVKSIQSEKIKTVFPKWLSEPTFLEIDLSEKEISISELSYLDDVSKKNLKDSEIDFLFPVQSTVIPWLMQNSQQFSLIRPSDICVSAPTGSGKTLAFVLPIVQCLKNRVISSIKALIVLPVVELANQVYKVFEAFVKDTDLNVVLLTGKKSFKGEQSALLNKSNNGFLSLVDIVVTTPGRLLDHIHRTEGFCLEHLRYLVIDEADRMMEEIQHGWLKQVEDAVYKSCSSSVCMCFSITGKRLSAFPYTACHLAVANPPLQKLLFSATLSQDPENLHSLSLYKPKLFTTQVSSTEWIGKCSVPETLTQCYIVCQDDAKALFLYHFVLQRQLKKVLCFVDSVERAQRLHLVLEEMGGLQVKEISSNYTPLQRKIILQQFSSGKINLVVCSDLVARGMDIKDIDCVISFDYTQSLKKYIHRIGRTARAGCAGTAVTLLKIDELSAFKKMLSASGIQIPEEVLIDTKDLEVHIPSFRAALLSADRKFNMKADTRLPSHKKKRKKKAQTDARNPSSSQDAQKVVNMAPT